MILGALVAPFVVLGPATAGPQLAKPACATPKQHNDLVRHVLRFSSRGGDYHASTITRQQLERLGQMRSCARRLDPDAYKRMRGFWDRRSDKWAFHRHIDAITPYGKWAIPEYIVMRESRGDPCAKNPSSTAAGYYQFLSSTWAAYGGTGGTAMCAPAWHQHEVAARAWDGGRGASHWALTA